MTHHELAELLRDHVSHDEPPAPLPLPALAAGRRKLRRRRLLATGGSVAALALAAAFVVPGLGAGSAGPDTAMDPEITSALENYDPLAMPELMDSHVRRVLEASVPDLGPSTFRAGDAQGQKLPEEYWHKASGLSVEFGSQAHRYSVDISHSRSEAEGDPERYCEEGLDDGTYVECTYFRTPDGDLVLSTVWALKQFDPQQPHMGWKVVTGPRLDDVDVDSLYFERRVKVIKSESLITYVSELVKATNRDPARAPFTTPLDDLVTIGSDPALVMPVPPPGDDGCPAWTMPSKEYQVSCEPRED
jgi:hypothetical protein